MPSRALLPIVLGCSLAALLLGGCSKSSEQWLTQGRESASQGKHDHAVAAFDKALAQPGAHVSGAQWAKAQSLFALKRWAEAARAAQASAQSLSPVSARPARVLALQAFAEAGDSAEAGRLLALLGPEALNDPAVAEAAKRLGLPTEKPGSSATAPAKSPRSYDISKVNALHVDIASVNPAGAAELAQFPLRNEFQDPRAVVKVPSPDGKRLVWRGLLEGKGYYLFLSDASGKGEQRLDACKNGYQPVWSPDGKRILFSAMDWRTEERNLFIYDLATKVSRRAFNAKQKVGALASWSPDGSKIVFTYFDELWIMNANGIGRGLLNLGGRMKMNVEDARVFAWSADGKRLAYGARGKQDLYIIDLTSKI